MTARTNLILFALIILTAIPLTADIFNLKVLSSNTPDMTDLPAFTASTTSAWPTNDEKARAIAYWLSRFGGQSAAPYDWMPIEPMLTFNNLSNCGFCAYWTGLYIGVAEGGLGWTGRHYEIRTADGGHTVPELEYDGKRHFFDGSNKYYALDCEGRVLGMDDLDENGGPCDLGPRGKYHNLLYHSPSAICRDLDGYKPGKKNMDSSPIRGWLMSGYLNWFDISFNLFNNPQDEKWVNSKWEKLNTGAVTGVYRYILNLRDNEHYTRHYAELNAASSDYFYPSTSGKYPGTPAKHGNGVWVFTPDLSQSQQFERAVNLLHSKKGVRLKKKTEAGIAEFKVQCANLMTGALLEADIFRAGDADTVIIEASANGGYSWAPVWNNAATGKISIKENISDRLKGTFKAKDLRTVLNYLVRVRLQSKTGNGARLEKLQLKTITTLNNQSLPGLRLGRNLISVNYDSKRQEQTKTLRPMLKNDLFKKDAVESKGVKTRKDQTAWSPVLAAAAKNEEGHVTFELEAPRPISRFRMGGDIWITGWKREDYVRFDYRLFNGKWSAWGTAGKFGTGTRTKYKSRRHQDQYVEKEIKAAKATKVQFKFALYNTTGQSGASHLRVEIDYAAPDSEFQPLEITYDWTEYKEPLPASPDKGGIKRQHTEIISKLPHTYYVNIGGDIQPRLNWIRTNLKGSAPEKSKAGYSDGKDAGDRDAIPLHTYAWGKKVSLDKPYSLSRPATGFKANGDEKELTDGRIRPVFDKGSWAPGEITQWGAGSPVEITVDLESLQKIDGARLDAHYHEKHKAGYPETVSVLTSEDGKAFELRGRDRFKGARYAHNDWNENWPQYNNHDNVKVGVFPDYGLRANYIFILFDKPVQARYVRFIVKPQKGLSLLVSEVNVYDRLSLNPWTPRLLHAAPADFDKDGMDDAWEILFLGSSAAKPGGDADKDGASNLQEFKKKTRPDSAAFK